MRHRMAGRKLGRTTSHRLALLRNMATSLFRHERITTTVIKAKELRPFAEKMITLAKRETLHARRQVLRHISDREVVAKLFDQLGARYATRPGGYTRIVRTGFRRGDNAEMALIELIDTAVETAKPKKKAAAKKKTAAPKAAPPRRSDRKGKARKEALADVAAAEEAAEAARGADAEAAPAEEAEPKKAEIKEKQGKDETAKAREKKGASKKPKDEKGGEKEKK